jgi:hypothetical protein
LIKFEIEEGVDAEKYAEEMMTSDFDSYEKTETCYG